MKLPAYTVFPTLSNDRILLRAIAPTDIEDIVPISFYDSLQATYVEQATAMQTKIDKDYRDGNSIHWGIEDKATQKIVGTCGFYRGFDKNAGELGCVLLPHYRGQGFMTSAMLLAIEFGQKTMGLQRIWAVTNQENKAAIQLLERLDFIKIADLDNDEIAYQLQ